LLTRLVREARARDAWLLAGVILLAALTRLHVGMLVLLFCGVYLVGLLLVLRSLWHRRAWRRLVLAGLVTIVFLSPLNWRVARLLAQPGGEDVLREGAEVQQADLLAYLLPPPQHPLLDTWTQPVYEERASPRSSAFSPVLDLVELLLHLCDATMSLCQFCDQLHLCAAVVVQTCPFGGRLLVLRNASLSFYHSLQSNHSPDAHRTVLHRPSGKPSPCASCLLSN
jgi:hypothetical protein